MKILLGVTGCIGAYKAAEVLRGLQKAGAQVRVVMTKHATEFISPLTFEAMNNLALIYSNSHQPDRALPLLEQAMRTDPENEAVYANAANYYVHQRDWKQALQNYDRALQTVAELSYDKWRDYDPEDTLRFYALRLHEAGLIKSGPNKIIAENTDWRFLDEVKRELKG